MKSRPHIFLTLKFQLLYKFGHVGNWKATHNCVDAEELVGTDFWDNGVLPDKHYHEFMSELLIPGKWK